MRTVEIEETYFKQCEDVLRKWRVLPKGDWTVEVTPYKEVPWVTYGPSPTYRRFLKDL